MESRQSYKQVLLFLVCAWLATACAVDENISATNTKTGTTVPGAPTIGTTSAGDSRATVRFTAPDSNGGSVITSYTVVSSSGQTATGTASPIAMTGLTNGSAYTFTVKATNSVGTGPASAASNSATPNPQAYALAALGDAKVPEMLDNQNIGGISLQAPWIDIETSNNNFAWTDLDAALRTAQDRGKGVTLRPLSAFKPGDPMLAWLKSQGMQTFLSTNELGVTNELALPWDNVFLSQYIEFVNALALHIKQAGYENTVVRIQVSAPINEVNIPGCANNLIGGVYPYDRAKYLAAWERVIDAFSVAIPNSLKQISATSGGICRPDTDTQFFRDMMGYATGKYGNGFIPSANDLSSTGSGRMSPYLDLAANGLAYQMLWNSTNASTNRLGGTYPTNLLQSVCAGLGDGADYVEIYAVDVLNPDATIQKAIRAVHDHSLCN